MNFRNLLASVAFLGLVLTANFSAQAFDYSSTVGSSILFPGDATFSFSPGASNFIVTSGSASGLFGEITGTFSIGTITTSGDISTAPVTGIGGFLVHDGAFTLSASLVWIDITQDGTGGVLNLNGSVNLTGITYGGSNPDLMALASAGSGLNALTFQFVPALSLATLRNGPGPNSTSFSGSVAVPEPGSAALIVFGLGVLTAAMVRSRAKNGTD
jgi:hypothetical protein